MTTAMLIIEIFLASAGLFFAVSGLIIIHIEKSRVNYNFLFAKVVALFCTPIVMHTIAELLISFNFQKTGTYIMDLRFVLPFIFAALDFIYSGIVDILGFREFYVDHSKFVDPQVADPKR